ncbi:MAG: type II toxin-antitoxin system RelE/ParE family toxin [Deltaproteobacteria bacterium]|nr:type II toxin-antitoxin system RelE/ParE family toxin [Deltaproteobacteria bacterium]
MNWTVKVSSKAEHYFNKLDRVLKERVKKELLKLSGYENPLSHENVKPLTGDLHGFYRLRIGNYRIIFALIKETKIIGVVNIAPRGDAY